MEVPAGRGRFPHLCVLSMWIKALWSDAFVAVACAQTRGDRLLEISPPHPTTNLLTFTVINFYCVNTSLRGGKETHGKLLSCQFPTRLMSIVGSSWKNVKYIPRFEDDWRSCSSLLQLLSFSFSLCSDSVNTEVLISPLASRPVWLTAGKLHLHVAAPQKQTEETSVFFPLPEFAGAWCVAN